MNWVIAISVSSGAIFAAAIAWLLRQIGHTGTHLPVTADWIEDLSVERYRPMMRLLDPDDARFLTSHPACQSEWERRLRVRRCQIFRGYLRCLNGDFGRVSMAIRILMVQSRYDRPDLARVLIRRRLEFLWRMAAAHVRLLLYGWGCSAVDVRHLVRTFDSLRLELRALLPASAATS